MPCSPDVRRWRPQTVGTGASLQRGQEPSPLARRDARQELHRVRHGEHQGKRQQELTSSPPSRPGIPFLGVVRPLRNARMFRAALTSRSCATPPPVQTHVLTPRPRSPRGPERAPQSAHVTRENRAWPSTETPASRLALYGNWCLTMPQAASYVDVAQGVLTSVGLDTSPMTMRLARRAMAVVAWCVQSLRTLGILACSAWTRCFLCARWAIAQAAACCRVRCGRAYWRPSEQVR